MDPQFYRFTRLMRSATLFLLISMIFSGCGNTRNPDSEAAGSTPLREVGVPLSSPSPTIDPLFATPTGLPGQPLTPYPGKPGETTFPTPIPPQPQITISPLPPGADPFDYTPVVAYTPPPTPLPSDPYHLIIDAAVVPGSIQEDTAHADLVITGTVVQILPARWSTPDGKRPLNPHANDNREYIFTPVQIHVDTVLKGRLIQPDILISAIGGTVGQDSVRWATDDQQTFNQGERVVLFLSKPGSMDRIQALDNHQLWHLTTRYTILSNGTAVNNYRRMPLLQLLNNIKS